MSEFSVQKFTSFKNKCCTAKSLKACPCCSNLKKEYTQLTKNYRHISLNDICCKLLEHIVYSIINNHLESGGILTDAQHGFRAKRSCETPLVSTMHDLTQRFLCKLYFGWIRPRVANEHLYLRKVLQSRTFINYLVPKLIFCSPLAMPFV